MQTNKMHKDKTQVFLSLWEHCCEEKDNALSLSFSTYSSSSFFISFFSRMKIHRTGCYPDFNRLYRKSMGFWAFLTASTHLLGNID